MESDELSIAKTKLFESLGDNFKSYLRLLRIWFKSNLTKEEFDAEARKLLTPEALNFHNQFLVALFNKCQLFSTNSGPKTLSNGTKAEGDDCVKVKTAKSRKKFKSGKVSFDRCFVPANIGEFVPNPYKSSRHDGDSRNPASLKLSYCNSEGTLPDHFMANLRILVCLWELGLDTVTDDAVSLLNIAIRDFVKNILTSVLTFKSSFRTFDNGVFKHAIGAPPINNYLKNAAAVRKSAEHHHFTSVDESGEQVSVIPPTVEFAEHEAMSQIACSFFANSSLKRNQDDEKITLWHLFHALRVDRSAIPSHSVYAVNIERIITRLWQEERT